MKNFFNIFDQLSQEKMIFPFNVIWVKFIKILRRFTDNNGVFRFWYLKQKISYKLNLSVKVAYFTLGVVYLAVPRKIVSESLIDVYQGDWIRGALGMVEKWPKEISKFGRKIKGVKMARYLVPSPKKCQHI